MEKVKQINTFVLKSIGIAILKYIGIFNVALFILALFCFGLILDILAENEAFVFVTEYTSIDNPCKNEEDCKFNEMKPSGNVVSPSSACITSSFNDSRSWGKHEAVDLAGGASSYDINASHDGVVSVNMYNAGSCLLYGKTYTYDAYPAVFVTNDEYRTMYLHMTDLEVSDGDRIHKGDVLGKMGGVGCSSARHLHYEVFKKTKNQYLKVDPEHGYIDVPHC